MPDFKSEPIHVTPQVARDLLKTCHYERQRRLRPARVMLLVQEIRSGRFIQGSQIHFGELPAGVRKLVNGYHTLTAIDIAGSAVDLTALTTPCANETELAQLYARHDRHATRNAGDALRAFGVFEEIIEDNRFKQSWFAAMAVRIVDFSATSGHPLQPLLASHELRIDVMHAYRDEGEYYFMALLKAPVGLRRLFVRRNVMAVALETFKYQRQAAEEFWYAASHDDGLRRGQPAKALVEWLLANPTNSGTQRMQQFAAAAAWNAHFEGRSTRYLKPGVIAKQGFRLAGSPWKGRGKRPRPVPCVQRELDLMNSEAVCGEAPVIEGQRLTGTGKIIRVAHKKA